MIFTTKSLGALEGLLDELVLKAFWDKFNGTKIHIVGQFKI